jgi:hypothetical protein
MVAAPKKNLGKMPCPDCRQPVAVMEAASGTLSYKCQEADCEATGFAQAHTAAARRWLAALGTRQAPPAAPAKPAAAPAPKADAKQPPKADAKKNDEPPRKGGFSLGDL